MRQVVTFTVVTHDVGEEELDEVLAFLDRRERRPGPRSGRRREQRMWWLSSGESLPLAFPTEWEAEWWRDNVFQPWRRGEARCWYASA